MTIKKIENKVNLESKNEVELQGCYNDCTEYKQKTKATYRLITSQGFKADGKQTVSEIREILSIFGSYCYKTKTCKTCIYW